ncbi:MAG: DUF4831 family protein [Porphyromonas sp.]|nr:DUF4831 family protein [Porphyromonas sp.]
MQQRRRIVALLGLLLVSSVLWAQTNVSKVTAGRNNDYGVVYTLPRSEIVIDVLVKQTTFRPGPLALYAASLVGQAADTEAFSRYEIEDIRLSSLGVPDPEHSYKVEFRSGTVAPFVLLDERGLIAAINAGPADLPVWAAPRRLPFDLDSLNRREVLCVSPSLPQEYAMAGSLSKQAEIAARYLYDIREGMVDLLKGNVESMPKDGASLRLLLDRLEAQEAATMHLFYGDHESRYTLHEVRITPQAEFSNRVAFRFSDALGAVNADDLRGKPIRMDLRIEDHSAEMDSEAEAKREKKLKGVVYNVPGTALVSLSMEGRTIAEAKLSIVQFGRKEALTPRLFKPQKDSSLQIRFDVETGAIQSVNELRYNKY